MKRIIRLTESDLTRIVKRVLRESNGDPTQYHRYLDGGNPGIETFFENPTDTILARELESQLKMDIYANRQNPTNIGKGTRKMFINFNNRKMTIDEFINQVQEDAEAFTCHTITNYDYDNKFIGATIITIKTEQGPCKKKVETNTSTGQETKQDSPITQKDVSTQKTCKYWVDLSKYTSEQIKSIQYQCKREYLYSGEYNDGTIKKCQEADGKAGCCTWTCIKKGGARISLP
jgi:hypothetical protein